MDLIPVMASTDTTVYEYVFSNMYSTSDRKISELLSQRAKAILINSMRKTSRLKTDSNTASKNNFILWRRVFRRCIHKTPTQVPILSQINPVHILPAVLRLPTVLLPSALPTKTQHAFLFCPAYDT